MKIAAIDTSSLSASVAITNDGKLVYQSFLNNGFTHSQKLMPLVDDAFSISGFKPSDMDMFVGVTGPGSFTGLRIGLSTVKGIAQGLKKPVYGVDSLVTLAMNCAGFDGLIVPIIDARRNQVYTAIYRWQDDRPIRTNDIDGIDINELIESIKSTGETAIFTGDALRLYRDIILEAGFRVTQPENSMITASSAAYLAGLIDESCYQKPNELIPYYLRKPQAQQALEKKLNISTSDNE